MVKTLIALPVLTNFTQHLVKIGLKLVLNSFSSPNLQNSRPGGGGGRVLPYKDSTGMCRAKAPPPSIFRTWLLYCFDVGHSKRPPFQKDLQTFWHQDAFFFAPRRFGPRRFGTKTLNAPRRFGTKTFWSLDVLAPDRWTDRFLNKPFPDSIITLAQHWNIVRTIGRPLALKVQHCTNVIQSW